MMVCVHAAVGAGLGGLLRRPGAAFAAGVASHLLCDLVPHKDYDITVEAPLAAVMFSYLAWRYGIRSPQFLGAWGAVSPDAENALEKFGVIAHEKTFFPTHNESVPWSVGHGAKVESALPQAALALIALLLADRDRVS